MADKKRITGDAGTIYTTPEDTKAIVSQELQREGQELRKDFLTIFALFAAFLTFLVTQVQTFVQPRRMAIIMGAMSFFAATSLTFVLALHNLIKDRSGLIEFLRPVFIVILTMFFFSFECFWFATHHNKLWY